MTENTPRKSPYVGPRAFQTGEQMFGRDYEIHELLNQLISERIVLLYAPSGAGKSSLVQAGLIPCMKEEGFNVLPVVRVSQPVPGTSVPSGFNRYVYSTILSLEEHVPAAKRHSEAVLIGMSLPEYLAQIKSEHAAGQLNLSSEVGANDQPEDGGEASLNTPGNLALIFDQFEEILTIDPNDKAGKTAFFNQLGEVLRDRSLWALFTMREDYLAALSPYLRPVPTHLSVHYRLDFLDEKGSADAIRKPAARVGTDFTQAAADLLINDLRRIQIQQPDGSFITELGPAVEPLQLQVVCLRLWKGLSESDSLIDEQDVEALGNVNVSLSEYYNQTVAEIAAEMKINERTLRNWFQAQLITASGIRGQVMLEPVNTKGLGNSAIYKLVDAHLVRSEKRGGATWFELAHDRLITPIRKSNADWFEANLSLLQKQAALWDEQSRPEGMLLRGKELDDARVWAKEHDDVLTPVERQFLKQCDDIFNREQETQQLREQTLLLESERQKADLAQRRAEEQKRAARTARLMLIGLSVLFVVAIMLAIFARGAAQTSIEQASTANAANTQVVAANGEIIAANSTIAVDRDVAVEAKNTAIASKITAEAALTAAAVSEELTNIKRAELTRQAADNQTKLELILRQTPEPTMYVLPTATPTAISAAVVNRSADLMVQAVEQQSQPDLSVLLAVEANKAADTFETRTTLVGLLNTFLLDKKASLGLDLSDATIPGGAGSVIKRGSPVNMLAFSPDGSTLAAAQGSSLHQWDVPGSLQSQKPVAAPITSQLSSGTVKGIFYGQSGGLVALVGKPEVNPFGLGQSPRLDRLTELSQPVDGVMVSIRSGKVDWEQVKQTAAFGYVRATTNDTNIDKGFADLWYGMKKAGIPRGAFHVFYFSTDPLVQAKQFLDVAGIQPGDLPPLLDVESSNAPSDMSLDTRVKRVLTWLEYVHKQTGLTPLLYVSLGSGAEDQSARALRDDPRLSAYPIWFLRYTETIDPNLTFGVRRWAFWHYSETAEVNGIRGGVNRVRFNGSLADLLALASQAYSASLQDSTTGNLLFTNRDEVSAMVASPSGRYLAFNSANSIQLIELLTYNALMQTQQAGQVLAINEAGRYLVIDNGNQPVLLTFDNQSYPLALFRPSVAAVSQDGQLVAFGSGSGEIALARAGDSLGEPKITNLPSPFKQVTQLAFSADGQSLMIGSVDGEMAWWSIKNGEWLIKSMPAHTGVITALVAGPEPDMFASGGQDGRVILWDLRRDELFRKACGLAGRSLTAREWQQYLYDKSYESTCPS